MYAEGPITDPKDLGPAIRRGIERVKEGEPALHRRGHAAAIGCESDRISAGYRDAQV